MRKLSYLLLLLVTACDYGSPLENLPPETKLFVSSIELTGTDRLNSVVKLYWSGEDRDGYIKGYELSGNGTAWTFVEETDSTFRFDIPSGSDTTDIDFYVRAIDNEDLVDPSPAYLSIPIRNSPPTARFDTVNLIPDTVYSVWSILWSIDDLDGRETLDSLFLRINDGPRYALDRFASFATFVPDNPTVNGEQAASVFLGSAGDLQPKLIEGLKVGENNRLYLVARDIAGSESPLDSTKLFFVRRQTADLLLIDAHGDNAANTVYFPLFNTVYPTYDYLDLINNLPPFWEPTFGKLLNLYDKVFWYSDGNQLTNLGSRLAMEVAAIPIQQYLNQAGKMLFTAKFPNPFPNASTPNQSPIFSFSPMDSFSTASGQARMPTDSMMIPQGAFATQFSPLSSSSFLTGMDPFYAKDPANVMYRGQLTPVSTWVGPRNLAARSLFTNGRTNQVFFSVELHKLNKNAAALQQCLDEILNQEFSW